MLVRGCHRTDLIDDFRRLKIPHQSAPAGEAELTAHGTAYLGRYTECPVARFRNQDAFDILAVSQTEKVFLRTIA